SAMGPPLRRRSRRAGSLRARKSVVAAPPPRKIARETHAFQYWTVPAGANSSSPITTPRTASDSEAFETRLFTRAPREGTGDERRERAADDEGPLGGGFRRGLRGHHYARADAEALRIPGKQLDLAEHTERCHRPDEHP